ADDAERREGHFHAERGSEDVSPSSSGGDQRGLSLFSATGCCPAWRNYRCGTSHQRFKETAMEAYLTFNGNAADALAFYAGCLGGKVLFSITFGASPMAGDVPAEAHDKIMHATLEARGHKLMAADAPPGYPFEGYKGFALSVQSNDAKEGEKIFNALAAGG